MPSTLFGNFQVCNIIFYITLLLDTFILTSKKHVFYSWPGWYWMVAWFGKISLSITKSNRYTMWLWLAFLSLSLQFKITNIKLVTTMHLLETIRKQEIILIIWFISFCVKPNTLTIEKLCTNFYSMVQETLMRNIPKRNKDFFFLEWVLLLIFFF